MPLPETLSFAPWTEYTRFFTALFVIVDPFGAIPILLSLTAGYSHVQRARVARIAALSVAIVLLVVAVAGEPILRLMGASLASFRVGGGIVLMLMAISMLRAQHDYTRTTPVEQEASEGHTIAVVPLAIPLLAGPGAISTVIIEMHRSTAPMHVAGVVGIIILVCMLLWLVMRLAVPVGKRLGPIGLRITQRIFGLILTAIAVEVMANGLRELFPVLRGTI